MNYRDVKPIESRPCSAWLVERADGRTFVQLWAPDAGIADVIEQYRNFGHDRFEVSQIMVGELEIKDTVLLYKADDRKIDQDLQVIVEDNR